MPPTSDPMTSGEVARTLAALTAQLERLRGDLAPVIARDAADAERFKQIEHRVTVLEGWQTWVTRLALGAVILGTLGLAWALGGG